MVICIVHTLLGMVHDCRRTFPTGQVGTSISDMPGTLAVVAMHGVGNPRESVSGRVASLLKFNPLKLKGFH